MDRSLLAFGASALLLVGFVVLLGPVALARQLTRTDPVIFGMGLVLVVLSLVCWSEALRPLLADASGPVSARRTFVAYAASMAGRQLVPAGAVTGPALTAFALDRESRLTYDETLAVVTVVEFLSTVASLGLAGMGVAVVAATGTVATPLRLLSAVLLGFAGLFLALGVVVWYRRRTVEWLVVGALRLVRATVGVRWPRLTRAVEPSRGAAHLQRFYGAIDAVAAHPRSLAVSFGYLLVGWLCMAIPLYTSALALDVSVSLALVAFVVPASLLVDVLPLPGGLGGIELALAGLLTTLAGVSAAAAGAVVVLYRLCSYWFLLVLGPLVAISGSVSVSELVAETRDRSSRR